MRGYHLLIELNNMDDNNREIIVPEDCTFEILHSSLQLLYGLDFLSDYRFLIDNQEIYTKNDHEETVFLGYYLDKKETIIYQYNVRYPIVMTIKVVEIVEGTSHLEILTTKGYFLDENVETFEEYLNVLQNDEDGFYDFSVGYVKDLFKQIQIDERIDEEIKIAFIEVLESLYQRFNHTSMQYASLINIGKAYFFVEKLDEHDYGFVIYENYVDYMIGSYNNLLGGVHALFTKGTGVLLTHQKIDHLKTLDGSFAVYHFAPLEDSIPIEYNYSLELLQQLQEFNACIQDDRAFIEFNSNYVSIHDNEYTVKEVVEIDPAYYFYFSYPHTITNKTHTYNPFYIDVRVRKEEFGEYTPFIIAGCNKGGILVEINENSMESTAIAINKVITDMINQEGIPTHIYTLSLNIAYMLEELSDDYNIEVCVEDVSHIIENYLKEYDLYQQELEDEQIDEIMDYVESLSIDELEKFINDFDDDNKLIN